MDKIRNLLVLIITFAGFIPILSQERGKASYYSKNLNGAMMSSGLRYHSDSMFCAHKRHPFGTLLKVVCLNNGKSVVVKVTDRGPFGRGRIIDLSYGAAKELGILSAGVATVEISVYREEKGVPFKIERSAELPELDFEIAEDSHSLLPVWMNPQRRNRLLKDMQQIEKIKSAIHPAAEKEYKNVKIQSGRPKQTAGKKPAVHKNIPHKASRRH